MCDGCDVLEDGWLVFMYLVMSRPCKGYETNVSILDRDCLENLKRFKWKLSTYFVPPSNTNKIILNTNKI